MQAGAGKAEINFPQGFFPTEGFVRALDPLFVRALVLRQDIVILSVEITSLGPEEIMMLKSIVREETGIPSERCWVLVTHTFSAPHILPDHALEGEQAYESKRVLQQAVRTAARDAVREARAHMAPATLRMGQSGCDINCNRDVEMPEGWWIGLGGQGYADHTLSVLLLDDLEGNRLAVLTHFAVQPSVLDGSQMRAGGKLASGDLAGKLSVELEALYPGSVAMFLLGAAGDQSPIHKAKAVQQQDEQWIERDLHDDGLELLSELAGRMRDSAVRACAEAAPLPDVPIQCSTSTCTLPAKRMPANMQELHPTRTYEYIADGERETEISLICLGPLALVGVQPELTSVTARQIAQGSPFEHTLTMTMVNGSAKYMADADSYDRITYEAMNSPFGRGAAEGLRDLAIELLGLAHKAEHPH